MSPIRRHMAAIGAGLQGLGGVVLVVGFIVGDINGFVTSHGGWLWLIVPGVFIAGGYYFVRADGQDRRKQDSALVERLLAELGPTSPVVEWMRYYFQPKRVPSIRFDELSGWYFEWRDDPRCRFHTRRLNRRLRRLLDDTAILLGHIETEMFGSDVRDEWEVPPEWEHSAQFRDRFYRALNTNTANRAAWLRAYGSLLDATHKKAV